jgi:FixJ family two-component response regulator
MRAAAGFCTVWGTLKLAPLRIAVVDDEAHIRKALERLMRGAGFEVETFASGVEYLACLEKSRPDCLVLDVHMPGLDGFDVQDSMRALGSRVPVVVITGHDNAGAEGHAIANGAFAYLKKPVDGDDLIDAITRAVAAGPR